MKVTATNDVKIYNVSAGKSVPQWLSDRQRRRLLHTDRELAERIELIQDFNMPESSTRIKESRNGEYIMATGVYKPRVKCFQTSELSLKFERYLDTETVQFEVLSDDYTKMVFLGADRSIEFHAQYGSHFKTRIPKFGRDMVYHQPSCDLVVGGAGSEAYRLNLDQGRFLQSYQTSASEINSCNVNPMHQFLSFGTVEGSVECWDPRQRRRMGILNVAPAVVSYAGVDVLEGIVPEVTTVRYGHDGLSMAVGTSSGHVAMYDIRSNKPLFIKDHQYGFPIKDIKFHEKSGKVLSCDKKVVKIWDKQSGDIFTSVEPEHDINDMCVISGSGLVCLAVEDPQIQSYYIPALHHAPSWCSFLDNITEELEQTKSQQEVFDDYKFVTKKELESLGLAHLIGTSLLRAYMHGFFMDIRLYNKAKLIADPFAYEDYKKKKIKEKIEEQRNNRIKVTKKLPKVNKAIAKQLMEEESLIEKKAISGKAAKSAEDRVAALHDDRFSSMFTNPDFEIDENSETFKLNNPSGKKKVASDLSFQFDEVDEESEPEGKPSDASSSEDESEDESPVVKEEKPKPAKAKDQTKFYELKTGEQFRRNFTEKDVKKLKKPLGERLIKEGLDEDNMNELHQSSVGNMEYTFVSDAHRKKEQERKEKRKQHMEERKKVRRGVKELHLKSAENKFWRGRKVK
eukprot:Nk52_evm7s326 gene=Nk52_evmTU7s326